MKKLMLKTLAVRLGELKDYPIKNYCLHGEMVSELFSFDLLMARMNTGVSLVGEGYSILKSIVGKDTIEKLFEMFSKHFIEKIDKRYFLNFLYNIKNSPDGVYDVKEYKELYDIDVNVLMNKVSNNDYIIAEATKEHLKSIGSKMSYGEYVKQISDNFIPESVTEYLHTINYMLDTCYKNPNVIKHYKRLIDYGFTNLGVEKIIDCDKILYSIKSRQDEIKDNFTYDNYEYKDTPGGSVYTGGDAVGYISNSIVDLLRPMLGKRIEYDSVIYRNKIELISSNEFIRKEGKVTMVFEGVDYDNFLKYHMEEHKN